MAQSESVTWLEKQIIDFLGTKIFCRLIKNIPVLKDHLYAIEDEEAGIGAECSGSNGNFYYCTTPGTLQKDTEGAQKIIYEYICAVVIKAIEI